MHLFPWMSFPRMSQAGEAFKDCWDQEACSVILCIVTHWEQCEWLTKGCIPLKVWFQCVSLFYSFTTWNSEPSLWLAPVSYLLLPSCHLCHAHSLTHIHTLWRSHSPVLDFNPCVWNLRQHRVSPSAFLLKAVGLPAARLWQVGCCSQPLPSPCQTNTASTNATLASSTNGLIPC